MSGTSIPPTNPTLPVRLAMAARTPTTKAPSCSLNTIDCTFGRSTTESMIANRVSGNSPATVSRADAYWKPTASTGSKPRRAKVRRAWTRWESVWTSKSRNSMPVSAVNCRAPFHTPSLNDLSNLPPRS